MRDLGIVFDNAGKDVGECWMTKLHPSGEIRIDHADPRILVMTSAQWTP